MEKKKWLELLNLEIEKEADFISSYPDRAHEATERLREKFDDDFVRMDFDADEYEEEIATRIEEFADFYA